MYATNVRTAPTVNQAMIQMAQAEHEDSVEGVAEGRQHQRNLIMEVADLFWDFPEGGDYKDAAFSRQQAILEAGEALGIEVVILVDAYDCPRSWDWDVL